MKHLLSGWRSLRQVIRGREVRTAHQGDGTRCRYHNGRHCTGERGTHNVRSTDTLADIAYLGLDGTCNSRLWSLKVRQISDADAGSPPISRSPVGFLCVSDVLSLYYMAIAA